MSDIFDKIELHDCPFCGGAGLLEEEQGWCWYAMCVDCGSQTAAFSYKTPEEREQAAHEAALVWNLGEIVRANPNE